MRASQQICNTNARKPTWEAMSENESCNPFNEYAMCMLQNLTGVQFLTMCRATLPINLQGERFKMQATGQVVISC